MSKIIKVIFSIGLVLFSVNASDQCTGLSQTNCQANSSCNWSKSNSFACGYKTNCNSFTTSATCPSTGESPSCKWDQSENPVCNLKANTCQLTTDNTACNYANSCTYTGAVTEACNVTGGTFGCSKNTSSDTCTANYCSWTNSVCSNTNQCNGLTKALCQQTGQGADYCSYVPSECTINKQAKQACSTQKNQTACEQFSCVWDTAQCVPPDASKCTLVTPEQGDPSCSISNESICSMSAGTCKTKANTCNSVPTENCNDATTFKFCSISEVGACSDVADFCQTATCQTQSPQCTYIKPSSAKCSNNDTKNECTAQTEQDGCEGIAYCSYKDDSLCQPTATCSTFLTQNLCTGNALCNWDSVYTCQQAQVPNTYSSLLGFGAASLCVAASLLA